MFNSHSAFSGRFSLAITVSLLAPLAFSGVVHADTYQWTNTTGSDAWFNLDTNWNPASTPGSASDVLFDLNAAYDVWWSDAVGEVTTRSLTVANTSRVTISNQDHYDPAIHHYHVAESVEVNDGNDPYISDPSVSSSLTLDGVSLTAANEITVGVMSGGLMAVQNGSAVSGFRGYIARYSESFGMVTVAGAGSSWTTTNSLSLGGGGTGILNVEDGGSVNGRVVSLGTGLDYEGQGTINVDGAGSTLTVTHAINIGDNSNGYLNIENGGTAASNHGFIGLVLYVQGEALVTGVGSTWTVDDRLVVGGMGHGGLTIQDGGSVTSSTGEIARDLEGTVIVTGDGSTWAVDDHLQVGYHGVGTMAIQDGGSVSSASAGIGYGYTGTYSDPNADSIVTVVGDGSVWTSSGDIEVGRERAFEPGRGTLVVADGGLVQAAGTVHISAEGSLYGDGTIEAATLYNAGLLAPGQSAGILTLNGDYVQDVAGILAIELAGTVSDSYDQLHITGHASLGGTLDLSRLDGFTPRYGDSFEILTGTTISGEFDEVLGEVVSDYHYFELIYETERVVLHVVPEPTTLSLLALGALPLLRRRCRRAAA